MGKDGRWKKEEWSRRRNLPNAQVCPRRTASSGNGQGLLTGFLLGRLYIPTGLCTIPSHFAQTCVIVGHHFLPGAGKTHGKRHKHGGSNIRLQTGNTDCAETRLRNRGTTIADRGQNNIPLSPGWTIYIAWVKGHKDIKGNERADKRSNETSILGHESEGVVTPAGLRAWARRVRAEVRGGNGEGILGWYRRVISAYTWYITEKGPRRKWVHKIKKAHTSECDCHLLEHIHPPHPSLRWVISESYLLPAIVLHTYRRLKCFYFYQLSCHFSSYFITLNYHLTYICFRLSVQLKLQIFLYFLPVLAQDMFQFMSLCSVP